jgi:hypothetical protein
MPNLGAGQESICLRVANLSLVLDARGTGMCLVMPECHTRFMAGAECGSDNGLALSVREGPIRQSEGWRPVYAPADGWQLWQDERERYVFVVQERSPPERQVTIDAGFRCGEVLGQFGNHGGAGKAGYPLENIEIMIFANWLANSGDLILHAAGVDCDGQGYCFAGTSGAGKSTLAAALAQTPNSTVLGEDNLVLRWLEGRFWIFGTPWHLNPAMCSPRGVPLAKMFFLDRTGKPGAQPCAPVDGIGRLLQSAFIPYYRPMAVAAILDRLTLLAEQVPFYTLHHLLGADVSGFIKDS